MKNALPVFLLFAAMAGCHRAPREGQARTFQFEMNFDYPGDPGFIYDHLTGDISAWWDHTFSKRPYKLYIEPRPGGGFFEIFDESGDGARHATVIMARRGEMLRMVGPLGLSGMAITLICTYTLQPSGDDGTLLTLQVNGSGEYSKETPELVRQVWEHFLWEQFRPYIVEKYNERN